MARPYDDVTSMINPNQFRTVRSSDPANTVHAEASEMPDSRFGHAQTGVVTHAAGGRYGAYGQAETKDDSATVDAAGTYRTPLRAKVAAIHAARQATHKLGRSG